MTGNLQIRSARQDELDAVAALIVEAFAEYAARMAPDAWSSYAQDIANVHGRLSDAELVVAERDGQLVGSVTMFSEWRGAQADSVGVRLLAVVPNARGTGVGRALMEHAIARGRARGKQRIVLTVVQGMDTVRELCDKLGFLREPALDHEPAPGVRAEGYALKL